MALSSSESTVDIIGLEYEVNQLMNKNYELHCEVLSLRSQTLSGQHCEMQEVDEDDAHPFVIGAPTSAVEKTKTKVVRQGSSAQESGICTF